MSSSRRKNRDIKCVFFIKFYREKNLPKQKKLSYTMNTDGRTDGRTDRMNDNDIRFSTKTAKSY